MNLSPETFSYIDIAFAKLTSPDAKDKKLTHFLSLLMKRSREGELSIYAPNMQEVTKSVVSGDRSPVVFYNDHYYLRRNWELETNVLLQIKRLSNAAPKLDSSVPIPSHLNEEQQKAFTTALLNPFFVLSGGPGTGKTHFAKALISSLLEKDPNLHILACAPTGKAAHRLKQKGVKTGTIHSLLGIRDQRDLQKEPKPLIGDLILIDECSMIDLSLWSYLLSAIESTTHLILIGDPNQLPPVDTNSIFSDLCHTKALPHVQLLNTNRTDKKNLIQLSSLVRDGKGDEALTLLQDKSQNEVSILPLTKDLPLITNETTCILTPFTKGPLGTDACNQQIDDRLQAKRKPIVICKNDYKLGLMNGERGFLDESKAYFTFDDEEKVFRKELLPHYELAYATTIHKSQGSEFDTVLLILPEESETLSRALIYTAITRAKSHLTLYAKEETFLNALQQNKPTSSNLSQRLLTA